MKRWGDFRVGRWIVSWSMPDVPLPSIRWYWRGDGNVGSIAFAFGSSGSDPIISVNGPDCTPPRWLVPLLERIGQA